MTAVGDLLKEFTEHAKNDSHEILTLTEKNGFVRQSERFHKRLATEDTSKYKVILRNDIAFNPYLVWAGAVAQNTVADSGIISPLYPTFRVRAGFDPRYVGRMLLTPQIIKRYDSIAFGSVPRRRRTSVNDFLNLEIPDPPPIEEQRRIAAILDHADFLRSLRKKQNAEILSIEKSLFLSIFGRPSTIRSGNIGSLMDLGELDRGVSKHRPRNDPRLLGGTYPLVQTGDVANSGGRITRYTSTYSDFGLAQSKLWPAGTLCITIAANIAKTGILAFPACFPDSVVGFTAPAHIVQYVRVWMSFLQSTLEAAAPQSAQKNINLSFLRNLSIRIPSEKSMENFAGQLSAVEASIGSIQKAGHEIDCLATALQSRAFSGKL